MAGVDVNTLTMEQYLALSRENQAPGVVKPEIEGNANFEIKSQFMRELREDTLSTNKERVLTGKHIGPGPQASQKQLEGHLQLKHDRVESFYRPGGEWYNDLLYKCPTHDINSHQKGPIPGMRPAEALTAIQTMADHSQKWHDGTTSRNIRSSSSKDGLAALVNKLDNLGRDMKKLKESVHAIQEVKQVEEVRYGEFGRTTPFNGSNGGKFHVGPPGYYTKIDNRPPYGEKRQSLEELLAKHQEESARRSTEMELTKEIRSDKTLDSSSEQIKTITADQETSGLNKLHGVSFISDPESDATEVLQHQLPRKELNPGNFTLPCTIGKFNFCAMADLGASINVMPRSIFEHLHLTNLRKTNMLCEMADMSKKAPLGIVENVLVKIGKFLFLSDFVIINNSPSETTILRRPFLATIHAKIDVFAGKISLGINEDRISFDSMRNRHKYTNPSERIFMVRPQSPAHSNNQIEYEESDPGCEEEVGRRGLDGALVVWVLVQYACSYGRVIFEKKGTSVLHEGFLEFGGLISFWLLNRIVGTVGVGVGKSFTTLAELKPNKQLCSFYDNHFHPNLPGCLTHRIASKVDVNNDLSKPVTTHYLPKEKEFAVAKPHHMIARGSPRWVPTGKIFTSSTTKVDSKPTNGSNDDITNQYECEQTLNVSRGTLNLSASTSFNPKKEGLRVCSELRIHKHSNKPSSSKLVPKVVPPANKTTTS
ncbi:zinc knuckle CX2CX4HX4C containing protein [Tanacetum coccineum]